MNPYWESKLTVKEAQALSKDGIAVLGNPVMRDILWAKDFDYPVGWFKNSYHRLDPKLFENRLGWVPAEPDED